MGTGYGCTCNKCGYSYHANLGVGFMFPIVYKETVEAMKKGDYGVQGKKFFEEHPDGAIACETVIARCTECGECGQVSDLTMYVPKKNIHPNAKKHGRWSVAMPFEGAEYFTSWELDEEFDVYEKYDHRCPKCNGRAEIIEDFENKLESGKLGCTKCDGTMEITGMIMWD